MYLNEDCNETHDADNGGVELDVTEATELCGFPDQVLGLRQAQLFDYLREVHFQQIGGSTGLSGRERGTEVLHVKITERD